MRLWIVILLCIGLLLVEPYLAKNRVSLQIEQSGPVSFSEFCIRMLGEVRYTLASYLWLNTEIYHHELGLIKITGSVGKEDPKKVGEIVAICNLVTRLDPHFVNAYDIGAWRLVQGIGDWNTGTRFLMEGIRNNPDSAELQEDMGDFYFFFRKDCADAIPYISSAYALRLNDSRGANGAAASAMARINLKGDDLRILANCYGRLGRKEEAIRYWQKVLELFPGDTPARGQIKRLESAP